MGALGSRWSGFGHGRGVHSVHRSSVRGLWYSSTPDLNTMAGQLVLYDASEHRLVGADIGYYRHLLEGVLAKQEGEQMVGGEGLVHHEEGVLAKLLVYDGLLRDPTVCVAVLLSSVQFVG